MMKNTVFKKFLDFCEYDYSTTDLNKYYESLGVISFIEILSERSIKIHTKESSISCKKGGEFLEMIGSMNNAKLSKTITGNKDVVDFLQNYKGGFFNRTKNKFYGKRIKDLIDLLINLYPFLPYEPRKVSFVNKGIRLDYEIETPESILTLNISFTIKSENNGILIVNIFDTYLFNEISNTPSLIPNYEEIKNLDSNVRKVFNFDAEKIKSQMEYFLNEYPKELEEIRESYKKTDSISRLNNLYSYSNN